jgi:transcriptional regulator with XRE-family HTH domain
MVALPFCNLEIVASKPKPDGYPEKVETLGEHLLARRMDLGLLQKDVAKILNVSTCSIENWENHRTYPMKSELQGVMNFLGEQSNFEKPEVEIGSRLKSYRRSNSLTQKQLSEQIGIGLNTLITAESAKNTIKPSTFSKIESFLNQHKS